ncbi:unnamed protein product, partial [Rotaria sp. Silwood2]
QRENEQLKKAIDQIREKSTEHEHVEIQTDEDIKALYEIIKQQSQELNILNEKNSRLISQDELDRQKKEIEERLIERENQIDNIMQEHTKLLEEIEKNASTIIPKTDNETQTVDHQHEKLFQMNNKLKRALQTIKDKIHRIVNERPDLFNGISEETNERLDHLISIIEHQATQIDLIQIEHQKADEQYQQQIGELQSSLLASQSELDNERQQHILADPSSFSATEDISPAIIEEYQTKIDRLVKSLIEKEDERILLRERLNEIELELRKVLDDQNSTFKKYELLVQERDLLVQQQKFPSIESQREIEELQDELIELKEIYIPSIDEIKSLKQTIEQQSENLIDLNEKNLILSSQLDTQKKEIEQQTSELDNLTKEYTKLLELISIEKINNETQTDDRQHEKLIQINNKLKRILQTFKEKIHRIVIEKPNLFDGISEETSERLDHLISIVENQTTQIDLIQTERDQLEKQLRNEIKKLEKSLETSQNELNYEQQVRIEQLAAAAPSEDLSSSIAEDYQKQIDELKQKLFENNEEKTLLCGRHNEVELELKEIKHKHELTLTKYKEELLSLVEERNELIEQQTISSTEHEREIEQLKKNNDQIREELTKLKQSPDCRHVEIQTYEDIDALHELIEQQTEQVKVLKEKCLSLANEIDSNAELQTEIERERKQTDKQLNEYKNQIETLMNVRTNLLQEIEKYTLSSIKTTNNQCQTDYDDQFKKLKRTFKTFKHKIYRFVNARPDLFNGIGEETSERLDHLISIVENQSTQINVLQVERNLIEEQLRNEIKELQNSLEAYKNQIENERLTKTEQIVSTSLSTPSSENISASLIEDYQNKIDQLQENLFQKDAEQVLLQERFNNIEFELKQTLMNKYETLLHERDELIQQQTFRLIENQCEIEQFMKLKQSADYQHVEIQTDEDIKALHEQLNDLNEKNLTLLSQIESQDELKRQKKEIEAQLNEHKTQIENLMNERQKLVEEIEKYISSSIQLVDNEIQTNDDDFEKLLQTNNTLKYTIDTINDKINHIITGRPDLFKDISEETNDRLDSLISTIENQTKQIIKLQSEYDQVEEKYQREINDLQR